MSKIVLQLEQSMAIMSELSPLLAKHWHEITMYPEFPLDPDIDLYTFLETSGIYKFYSAREDEKLVGYVAYFVKGHHHYKSTLFAIEDIFFVSPEYRTKSLGLKLLKFAEQELQKLGVQVVYHHTKVAHNIGALFEHLGYSASDIIYSKKLEKV